MASEGSPVSPGCLLIAQSLGFSPRSRAGTSGSQGVPANSRRPTSGFPTGAPFLKSVALPIELATHTPRGNRTPANSVKGCRANRYTMGAHLPPVYARTVRLGCEHVFVRVITGRPSSPRPNDVMRTCTKHGEAIFRKYGDRWKCRRCVGEAVTRRHRKVRSILVTEAGGRCALCGYDCCEWNLHFHHVDPTTKSFSMTMGSGKSLAAYRAEAMKCVLLCA